MLGRIRKAIRAIDFGDGKVSVSISIDRVVDGSPKQSIEFVWTKGQVRLRFSIGPDVKYSETFTERRDLLKAITKLADLYKFRDE